MLDVPGKLGLEQEDVYEEVFIFDELDLHAAKPEPQTTPVEEIESSK